MLDFIKSSMFQTRNEIYVKLMLATLNNQPGISEFFQIHYLRFLLAMINTAEHVIDKDSMNMTDKTPHSIIYHDDLLSVYHYRQLNDDKIRIGDSYMTVSDRLQPVPLVCVPPLLAPGFAFDLFPERSIVRYFMARGFDVYLIDFGTPDKEHAHLSFETYIMQWMPAAIKAIRSDSGIDDLSLFGYCMGGLFCLLYTAIHEDAHVRNLVTVASPIDMHQMGAAGKLFSIAAWPAQMFGKQLDFDLRDIDPKYMHIPGILGTLVFHMTNPTGFIKSQFSLIKNLWDRDYISAHESLGYWINNLLDYPGATFQDIIVQMGLGNKLAKKGEMKIGDKNAELKKINCSMLSFAGKDDEIVPVKSAKKILDVVSSGDKEFHVVPGGHVGLIIGNQAPDNLWETTADWLVERSDYRYETTKNISEPVDNHEED